jgi:two-component system, OmpR family, phosphate regulon sensor histidine kinase PhoR
MNLPEPRKLAFLNTLLTSVVAMTAWLISLFISGLYLQPMELLLNAAAVFFVVFFFLQLTLERFIFQKIKTSNNTISISRLPGESGTHIQNITGRTLEKVQEEEALRRGEDHKLEIERLEKMAQYRREFLGNISHELKTPIFNIQGYVLTLLDGGLEDPSINREYLERTEISINRLITIVDDLENISNLESGAAKLNLNRFDIVALAREVADFMEIKALSQGKTIYFPETYKSVFVIADRERIRQVFENLLDNSLKYGRKEDGKTRISFLVMDKEVLVEITDDGPGIEPQDIPRIFERFYRADKARSREQGGSGLGLSIVKHIIEAHDKSIEVQSTKGKGTTFAFRLSLG